MAGSRRKLAKALHSCDVREVPDQDFVSIHRGLLAQHKNQNNSICCDDLFEDPVFPPDLSSLTYVYSGDDKYEDMVFCRPKELSDMPSLVGEDGVSGLRLPLCRWNDRQWFMYALAVASLSPESMANVIPGLRHMPQTFQKDYTGCFHFLLWRFGSWVDVVVDDTLPVLYGHLAYCPASGQPPEFWAPLVEKAYAKIKKAYEAIESGDTLNALTDLTGAVCERYCPEGPPSRDLFHIIFKSVVYRSLVVCRRTLRSYKEKGTGFRQASLTGRIAYAKYKSDCCISYVSDVNQDFEDTGDNCLHVITTATKFPLRDGRLLEMLRMKNPYEKSVTWQGEFSVGNDTSWNQVNPGFMKNYKPKDCLSEAEFWISFLDFQKHFSDLVICSSPVPHVGVKLNSKRKFKATPPLAKCANGTNGSSGMKTPTPPGKRSSTGTMGSHLDLPPTYNKDKRGSIEIRVSEGRRTVKVDTISSDSRSGRGKFSDEDCHHRRSRSAKATVDRDKSRHHSSNRGSNLHSNEEVLESSSSKAWVFPSRKKSSIPCMDPCRQGSVHSNTSDFSHESTASGESTSGISSACYGVDGSTSLFSNLSSWAQSGASSISDSESTHSASDIQVRMRSQHRKVSKKPRNRHSASLPNLNKDIEDSESQMRPEKPNIFESHMDYFRPSGAWKVIVSTFGSWTDALCGGPPSDMMSHSKNPRILFSIPKPDALSEVVPSSVRGKCHVLVSLLQDYRQGANTANGMLVKIGFCLYRVKHADKDERRRNLGKLTRVAEAKTQFECREITARFDLNPGWYLMVPFTKIPGHTGQFLVRILGEKDRAVAKTGCVLS